MNPSGAGPLRNEAEDRSVPGEGDPGEMGAWELLG